MLRRRFVNIEKHLFSESGFALSLKDNDPRNPLVSELIFMLNEEPRKDGAIGGA